MSKIVRKFTTDMGDQPSIVSYPAYCPEHYCPASYYKASGRFNATAQCEDCLICETHCGCEVVQCVLVPVKGYTIRRKEKP